MTSKQDSASYLERKRQFSRMLTVFGRKTVLEALQDPNNLAVKLHLANSNKKAAILDQIIELAQKKSVEIAQHDRLQLSRISKNAKQDQGVALDLQPSGFEELDEHTFAHLNATDEFIALDRITNPQNLGMIIRSVCASQMRALIIPRKGCAKIDALVIKASAGTLFRAPIIRCEQLSDALEQAQKHNCKVVGLDLNASTTLAELPANENRIFVLGNETDGISKETQSLCDYGVKIPMANNVESLNVAVTASLIALRHQL